MVGKVLNVHKEAINTNLNKFNLDDLDQAAKLLDRHARRLEFNEFGGSAVVAKDAFHKFFRLVQLAILGILFVAVAMKSIEETKVQLDRVKRSLVDKRQVRVIPWMIKLSEFPTNSSKPQLSLP